MTTTGEVKWQGSQKPRCDFCQCDLLEKEFFIDGKTRRGPWALMCPSDHRMNGLGIGTGLGQKYDPDTMLKIEG